MLFLRLYGDLSLLETRKRPKSPLNGAGKPISLSNYKFNHKNMENNTLDGAGDNKSEQSVIKEYFKGLQKKSALSRQKRDPDTYKRMAKLRWESKDDLEIITE